MMDKELRNHRIQRVLNLEGAAYYLSISTGKLKSLSKKYKELSFKIDGCRRYDVFDLDNFIEKIKNQQN